MEEGTAPIKAIGFVFENSLKNLTKEQFECLYYLLNNENSSNESQKEKTKKQGKEEDSDSSDCDTSSDDEGDGKEEKRKTSNWQTSARLYLHHKRSGVLHPYAEKGVSHLIGNEEKDNNLGILVKPDKVIEKGRVILQEFPLIYFLHQGLFDYKENKRVTDLECAVMVATNIVRKNLDLKIASDLNNVYPRKPDDMHNEMVRNYSNSGFQAHYANRVSKLSLKIISNFISKNGESGVYPLGGLINHSCDPCALIDRTGFTQSGCIDNSTNKKSGVGLMLKIIALRDIKGNEEVTIDYGKYAEIENVINRRSAIQKDLLFVCECTRCVLEWEETFQNFETTGVDSVAIRNDNGSLTMIATKTKKTTDSSVIDV